MKKQRGNPGAAKMDCTALSVEIVSKKIQKVQLAKVQYPTRQHLTKTVKKTFMKKPLTKFTSPPTARLSHCCLGEGKALGLLTLVYKILSHCREIVKFILSHQVSANLSLWSNHSLKKTNYSHCSGVLSLFEPSNDVPTSFHTFKLWCKTSNRYKATNYCQERLPGNQYFKDLQL